MALIVESGAGLANAESYISVADATAYHAARGNAAWAAVASDAVREQLLRKATENLTQTYSMGWKGDRVLPTQALDWPRYDVCVDGFAVASNVVPLTVANACAELALRAIGGDLAPDVGAQVVSETVGPISTTYATGARQIPKYSVVAGMLAKYLRGNGSQIGLVRA